MCKFLSEKEKQTQTEDETNKRQCGNTIRDGFFFFSLMVTSIFNFAFILHQQTVFCDADERLTSHTALNKSLKNLQRGNGVRYVITLG